MTQAPPSPLKWDYENHPVRVTEPELRPPWAGAASVAFDGYGSHGARPARGRAWQSVLHTDGAPYTCEIDYGQPIALSALVHYFFVPGSRDLRSLATGPSAFRRLRLWARVGEEWQVAGEFADLPEECPQVLPVTGAWRARFWRIEVLELSPAAGALCTYQIESYTGGVPEAPPPVPGYPDLPAAFAQRQRLHRPPTPVDGRFERSADGSGFGLTLSAGAQVVRVSLQVHQQAATLVFTAEGENLWRAALPDGQLWLHAEPAALGLLIEVSFEPGPVARAAWARVQLTLSASDVDLYYIPAYAWSHTPVETMVQGANLQTRMLALGTGGAMVCLFPGTDRGRYGFAGGAACCDLVVGSAATPLALTVVPGDWWQAYRHAVQAVYDFGEQPQTVPVSEIQHGIGNFMMRDEVWEPTLGTVRSWPERDPHSQLYGFDCFNLYGVPYSIPTYWARYLMQGDRAALARCRAIVSWLCRSHVRVAEGAAAGAFYTLQRFPPGTPPSSDRTGSTQGWGLDTLTSQATGAALWSLLYYRSVSGEEDPEIDRVIALAADWLLRTQHADGGWPFGHNLQGQEIDAAPSSGSIWNLWALWRLGRQTGDERCMQAAIRARDWYAGKFVATHYYHGYWEDVGPGSREGYEAAIAAVAFGEMGEPELAIAAARDAVQWVFTRQIECREPGNSAGLVAEQTGWPPAAYCSPMMGLAAHTAWQISGDDFWRPFAMAPKAIGWWYQPETGAQVWIVDSTQMAPVVGPVFESWWSDWCIAQSGTLTLRWLVREIKRHAGPNCTLDEDALAGQLLGRQIRAWAPAGGLRPILPQHGQVNWLGMWAEADGLATGLFVALLNYGPTDAVTLALDSRDVNGALLWPVAAHYCRDGKVQSVRWRGEMPVTIEQDAMLILEWGVRK